MTETIELTFKLFIQTFSACNKFPFIVKYCVNVGLCLVFCVFEM